MSELGKIKDLMDKKFEELKSELQSSCLHEETTEWMEEWWAVAHGTGYLVKQCKRCGKEMERRRGWVEFKSDDEGRLVKVEHVMTPEEEAEEKARQEEEFKRLEESHKKAEKEGRIIRI